MASGVMVTFLFNDLNNNLNVFLPVIECVLCCVDTQVLLMTDILVFLQEKDQRYIFPCLVRICIHLHMNTDSNLRDPLFDVNEWKNKYSYLRFYFFVSSCVFFL